MNEWRYVEPLGHKLFVAPCLLLICRFADIADSPVSAIQATRLHEPVFATAWAEGEAMTLDDATSYALLLATDD